MNAAGSTRSKSIPCATRHPCRVPTPRIPLNNLRLVPDTQGTTSTATVRTMVGKRPFPHPQDTGRSAGIVARDKPSAFGAEVDPPRRHSTTSLSFSQSALGDSRLTRESTSFRRLEVTHGEYVARRTRLAEDRSSGPARIPGARAEQKSSGRRGGGGLRLLSWVLWMIPLGLLAGAGAFALPPVRPDAVSTRSERGAGPADDDGGSGETPDRQGIPQVAVSSDDRHQDRRPGREDVRRGGDEGQEGRHARRHRTQ